MTRQEIKAKVDAFLVEELEIDEAKISDDALLKQDLGIDSLDLVDVIVLIKNEFGVKVETSDLGKLQALGNLYDFIKQKIQA
ncbi:MAG: acyl carrier protein [Bacteroidales bacterium]|nr:acyl carrier protein [Bacteroidales bacterium]MDY6001526.1 acyl carrier protein [Candidatus Cryptobacteroides sp.]